MSLLITNVTNETVELFSNNQKTILENKVTNVSESVDEYNQNVEQETVKKYKTTKEIVEDYFVNTPIMVEIASCESGFRQLDANGSVLRGRVNNSDVGVMQINEYYHLKTANSLGIDIHTLEGNLAYAKYLYDKEGTKPWIHSSKCWNTIREVTLNY